MQSADGKELSNPFSAASLAGLRPSEAAVAAAAGLAAHHHGLAWPLFNLQHPFFHHSIDPRLPFGAGAFRPLTPGDEQLKPYQPFGSAAALCGQQQQQQQASPHHHQTQKGIKLSEPFNLSRYNPLFSLGPVESSLAAGRLVFSGAQPPPRAGQQPESPSLANNSSGAGSASPPGTMAPGADSLEPRDAAATPSSDAGTDPRSTPDDVRASRRKSRSRPSPPLAIGPFRSRPRPPPLARPMGAGRRRLIRAGRPFASASDGFWSEFLFSSAARRCQRS